MGKESQVRPALNCNVWNSKAVGMLPALHSLTTNTTKTVYSVIKCEVLGALVFHVTKWRKFQDSLWGDVLLPDLTSVHFLFTITMTEWSDQNYSRCFRMKSGELRAQAHRTEACSAMLSLSTQWHTEQIQQYTSLCCSAESDFCIHLGNRNKAFKHSKCPRRK